MARDAETTQAAALWTWSAIAGGVVAALIIQAMLTMLALGVGLFALDVPTAADAPVTVSAAALLWWIASGVFAAFVGGAVAGAYAPVRNDKARTVHAVAAWAVASLIVLGPPTGTQTAGFTNARPPARMPAAMCTGIPLSNAGIAPAMARISTSTEMSCKDRPSHLWPGWIDGRRNHARDADVFHPAALAHHRPG